MSATDWDKVQRDLAQVDVASLALDGLSALNRQFLEYLSAGLSAILDGSLSTQQARKLNATIGRLQKDMAQRWRREMPRRPHRPSRKRVVTLFPDGHVEVRKAS